MARILSLVLCAFLTAPAFAEEAPMNEDFSKVEESTLQKVKAALKEIDHLKINVDWERFQTDPHYQEEIATLLVETAKRLNDQTNGGDWLDFDGGFVCLGVGYQKGYGIWAAACIDPIDVTYIDFSQELWPQIADRILVATEWSFGIQLGVEAGVYVMLRNGFAGSWSTSRDQLYEMNFVGLQVGVRWAGGLGVKTMTAIGGQGNIVSIGKTFGVGGKASVNFMWFWSLAQVLGVYDNLFNYFGIKAEEAREKSGQYQLE